MIKNLWIISLGLILMGIIANVIFQCACIKPDNLSYLESLTYDYTSTGLKFAWPFYALATASSIYGLFKWHAQNLFSKIALIILLLFAILIIA